MPSITIRFDTNDIWTECATHNINQDPVGNIDGFVVDNKYIRLLDSASGAVPTTRTFVLISPFLANNTISRLLTVLKQNRLTSGFSPDEALFYERVVIVDPNGDFPLTDLLPLQNAGINVNTIPAGTSGEMSNALVNLL